jgi:hypothetical protein
MEAQLASPSLPGRMRPSLAGAWRQAGPAQRFASLVGGALVLVGLAHLTAWLVAGGAWQGPVSFRKPTTFGISFGLTTSTLAWVTGRLRIADRTRWLLLGPLALRTPTPDSRRDHATQGDQIDLHRSDGIAAAQAMRDEFET